MAEQSNIEWTDATWNPWHGCHKVSAECKNCYMFRDKRRYGQDPNVVVRSKTGFYDPLKWTEPKRIFTCSWSDFFIEEADPWRDEAFATSLGITAEWEFRGCCSSDLGRSSTERERKGVLRRPFP